MPFGLLAVIVSVLMFAYEEKPAGATGRGDATAVPTDANLELHTV